MKTKGTVNVLVLLFLLIAALVFSGLIASLTTDVEWLKWLTWGESIGVDNFALDLSVIKFSLSFHMQINALQILCIGAALYIKKKFF